MPSIVHGFDWPDRLVVGTIGRPGERSFYLQARSGKRVTSVALEKEQTAVLAEKIDELLDEVPTVEANRFSVPDTAPVELRDPEPLDQPVEPEFRAGALSLGFDPSTAQVVIEAYPIDDDVEIVSEESEDGIEIEAVVEIPEPDELFQVKIPVGTARAFVERTREIVAAGRRPGDA
ncbi:putative repeat protein (TIGR03847 family) [Curtobacterium sp. PvP017]